MRHEFDREEVFIWQGHGNDPGRRFQVTHMYESILAGRLKTESIEMALDHTGYELIMRDRGVEEWKVRRLNTMALEIPGLLCHFPSDDSHLLVDGTHRYVRLWRDGIREMACFLLAYDDWQPYAQRI